MIALLQRVRHASVTVDGALIGAIDAGLLVFLCAEKGDTEREGDALLAKQPVSSENPDPRQDPGFETQLLKQVADNKWTIDWIGVES